MKRRKATIGVDRCAYLFIAPYYIFFLLFVVFPLVMTIILSFTNYNLKSIDFIGIKNYKSVLDDAVFWTSVRNTFVYVLFTVFFTLVLGLMLAIVLNSTALWGSKFFRGVIYIPYVTSMAAISMVWLWLYDPTKGFFNAVVETLGGSSQQWLYDEKYAMAAVILIGVWKNVGYYMTLFLAGLNGIPAYLYEAARVDGAKPIHQFWKITLPMLRPVTFFVLITGVIGAFNVFEQVNIMTKGGPMNSTTTIVHQIYSRAFTEYKMGYAAAESIFLLVIVLIFTLLNFRYGNQGSDTDMG